MSETKLVQGNVAISSPLSAVSRPVHPKQSTIPSIGVSPILVFQHTESGQVVLCGVGQFGEHRLALKTVKS